MSSSKTRRLWSATRLFALALCATLLLLPTAAIAQESPQFGNWGPEAAPPDQEGVDSAPPPAAGAASSPATPNAAPAPGGFAGPPISAGCPYDLRGTWLNYGRGMSGTVGPYSASVTVRQFRTWIQAQQDDGTSYYGQCTGNRLQFDVYTGNQYIGRESGTVANSFPNPVPLPAGPLQPGAAPSVAPAPPVPFNNSATWLNFTWSTSSGTGVETWYRQAGVFPGGGGSVPGGPPTAVPPTAPAPAPAAVHIDSLQPAQGPAGTSIVVNGSGFAGDDNQVTFGPASNLHHPDGTPGNVVAHLGSADGTTLRFTVPRTGPSGILCDESARCVGISASLLQPGGYDVTVINASGTSNAVTFQLTS